MHCSHHVIDNWGGGGGGDKWELFEDVSKLITCCSGVVTNMQGPVQILHTCYCTRDGLKICMKLARLEPGPSRLSYTLANIANFSVLVCSCSARIFLLSTRPPHG